MANDVRLIAEPFDTPEVAALCKAQQDELADRYGFPDPDPDNLDASQFTTENGGCFFVARRGPDAIACGGIRRYDDTTGEIKRMYTVPHARRQGIGAEIVERVESQARGFGYTRMILETGVKQQDAIGLYLKLGYAQIECYGIYAQFELSRCFAKRLG
jgi:GNAT superfamily N-acetyltransferase